jgi:chromosome segregation protein
VQFERLRLSGFKSFVDPVEFRIEPGLTGVVGPNGCGKSNLLEALRWVMGASSAKAMRGSGMEDVIFAGASGRPSRGWAEVTLSIDNASRLAPQPFTDAPVLEVARRIDRGSGSTYRVNGKEVRARDVQLLFADASTGANSPALVRQGQISELIAAKPQNRRRILEEAAGVSGLHTRRHEAELRLRAAEANLARLDDIGREIELAYSRLKREARLAERYKKVSAEIRALQAAVLWARWNEARAGAEQAAADLAVAAEAVQTTAIAAAAAESAALNAAEAIKPLREEDAVAAAVLHRATLERDRFDLEAKQASADADRAKADLDRISADSAREASAAEDARAQLERLAAELEAARADVDNAPARAPELEAAFKAADARRAEADREVERLAAELAAENARAQAAEARLRDATARLARAEQALASAKAARVQAAEARVREASARLARAEQALAGAQADRARIGPLETPEAAAARGKLAETVAALQAARAAVEEAEAARAAAVQAEAAAREAARQHEDKLGRLQTEARGLAQLLAGAKREFPPALDAIRAEKGWEAALAAALGEDLDAALDPRAFAFWGGADATPPAWPAEVEPISAHVTAPPALAARLNFVGVVDAKDGDRLARSLTPGARLASRAGDLWRWDGFVARADAPKPAAVRLAQRARLSEIEDEIDRLRPAADAASAAQKAAVEALRRADDALKALRDGPRNAERAVAGARDTVERLAREQAQREARAQALDETVGRLEGELEEARATADAAGADQPMALDETIRRLEGELDEARAAADAARTAAEPVALDGQEQALAAARDAAAAARAEAAQARVALDAEAREQDARRRRLQGLERDHGDWTRRAAAAAERITALSADHDGAELARTRAVAARDGMGERRDRLFDAFSTADARRKAAADALASADAELKDLEKASRAAEHAAGEAREKRAGAQARAEASGARLAEVDAHVRETAQMPPEDLGRKLREEAIAQPADAAGAESLLYGLERERDELGLVNLRAEEEAAEHHTRLQTMRSERADLVGAIAKLRDGIDELNAEGRERLVSAFDVINTWFQTLFHALFEGGQAELKLVESEDPLEAGLEIYACPPGKRLATMSLMSGGEQALTAAALIFGVFMANPAPICVLDEVDAPLDDANVDRFCRMLHEMRSRTNTRFVIITHNPVTMSRVDRLFGVTMPERGVSQLVSVDLTQATAMAAE